jgi:uncharacterized protein YfaS (alpha-2-macroglobulin family)
MYESNSTINNITGTSTNSVTGYCNPVADVSAVSRQTTLIHKLLAEHREVQGVVEQRLHSVLNPNAPSAQGGVDKQQAASSPLVGDLEGFATALQQLLTGYQNILSRLDL